MHSGNHCESLTATRAEQFLLSTYHDLRRLANAILKQEKSSQSTQSTALVHEATVRVLGRNPDAFEGREHFFRTMVREMRRILVDAARKRKHRNHRSLDESHVTDNMAASFDPVEILALDEALEMLQRIDSTQAQIAELRMLGGLSHSEIATILSISERTVERKWAYARCQLSLALEVNRL